MSAFYRRSLSIFFLITIVVPTSGCDQVKKLVNYLSPNSASYEETQTPAKPAPQLSSEASAPSSESQPIDQQDEKPSADVPDQAVSQELAPGVLARVGDWTMTSEEFYARLDTVKTMIPDFDPKDIEQKKYILGEIVQQQLLAQEAKSRKMDQTQEFQAAMEDFRNTLLVNSLAEKLAEAIDVSEEEMTAFYDENPEFFQTPTEWQVREIVADSQEKARQLLVSINQGDSFEDLAKTQPIIKKAENGGDLGFLTIKTGDPRLDTNAFPFEKMEQVVTALDVGGVSGSFQGPEGFYVVKLESRRDGEKQKLEDVREDLKQYLIVMKQQQILIETLNAAQQKYNININESLLEE